MGMRADIMGTEVRFGGLVADAIKELGIDSSDGICVLTSSEVSKVIHILIGNFEDGIPIMKYYPTDFNRRMVHIRKAAHTLHLMSQWLYHNASVEGARITFA